MSASKSSPFKRHPTRHRGINYRKTASGERTYYVYFGGKYHSRGSLQDALALQGELRAKAAKGEKTTTPSKMLFSEVAESWYESKYRLRGTTRKTYRSTLDRVLIPRFESRKIASFGVEDVTKLIRDLEGEGLRPTSINAYMQPLRSVFKFAVKRGLISTNPCDALTSDDRPHSDVESTPDHEWTQKEMGNLIAAAEGVARQPESRYDYSPIIRVALGTGLRIGELLGLTWEDIDLKKGELHVRRQWLRAGTYGPPKTKAGVRRVPLPDDLVSYLRGLKLRSGFSQPEHPVFVSKTGKPLGHRNLTRRGFEPIAKKARLDGVSFHDMRHAFASRMIWRGTSPTDLARVMGHESSAVTEKVYIHLFNRQETDSKIKDAMAW